MSARALSASAMNADYAEPPPPPAHRHFHFHMRGKDSWQQDDEGWSAGGLFFKEKLSADDAAPASEQLPPLATSCRRSDPQRKAIHVLPRACGFPDDIVRSARVACMGAGAVASSCSTMPRVEANEGAHQNIAPEPL